jgi:hypothetical protein
MIVVSFCCNDDRGNFVDKVCEVCIGEDIHLAGDPLRMSWIDQHVKVGRRTFRCGPRQVWIGNVFWDGANMTKAWAIALVRYLIERGWVVEQYAEDGPFADLVPR